MSSTASGFEGRNCEKETRSVDLEKKGKAEEPKQERINIDEASSIEQDPASRPPDFNDIERESKAAPEPVVVEVPIHGKKTRKAVYVRDKKTNVADLLDKLPSLTLRQKIESYLNSINKYSDENNDNDGIKEGQEGIV